MLFLNVNYANYKLLLTEIATRLHIPYNGEDVLVLNEKGAKGIVRVLSLFDELQVLLTNATFDSDIIITRERSDKRYFILHFDDLHITDTFKFKVDNELLQKTNTHHAVARLTSNIFLNIEEIPAGMNIKSIKVLFNEQWLKQYLGLDKDADVLQKYLSLKTESFDIEKLDSEYLKLMDELWNAPKNDLLENIFLQNRVTLLVERFFTRLFAKMELLEGKFNLTKDEMERLVHVEKTLASDFSKLPPTIDEFSRMSSMSSTKLKKSFKEMYGDSIYSYYQKLRLQKAKDLLETGSYTVKQAAEAIGYSNASNFIQAFKKQFNTSPGELATMH